MQQRLEVEVKNFTMSLARQSVQAVLEDHKSNDIKLSARPQKRWVMMKGIVGKMWKSPKQEAVVKDFFLV